MDTVNHPSCMSDFYGSEPSPIPSLPATKIRARIHGDAKNDVIDFWRNSSINSHIASNAKHTKSNQTEAKLPSVLFQEKTVFYVFFSSLLSISFSTFSSFWKQQHRQWQRQRQQSRLPQQKQKDMHTHIWIYWDRPIISGSQLVIWMEVLSSERIIIDVCMHALTLSCYKHTWFPPLSLSSIFVGCCCCCCEHTHAYVCGMYCV